MARKAEGLRQRLLTQHPTAELVERGRNSLTYKIGVDPITGRERRKALFTSGPLHYLENGEWQEIDTSWRDSDDPTFTDRMDAADYRVYSSANGRRRIYPRRDRLDEYVEFQAPELRNPAGRWRPASFGQRGRSNSRLQWDTLGASVETIAGELRFKVNFNILIPQAVAPIRWRYNLVGLKRVDSLVMANSDGAVVFQFDPFVMTDADGTERLVDHVLTDYEVELYPQTVDLVFPIAVDPSVSFNPAVAGDDGQCDQTGGNYSTVSPNLILGWTSSTFKYNSFVRFPGITITQAQTISAASVDFTGVTTDSGNTCNVNIYAHAADNANAPTNASQVNSATLTTASEVWGNVPTFTAGGVYTTSDISPVIQEVLDRAGWTSGNAIVLQFRNATSSTSGAFRRPASYDNTTYDPPTLSITYTAAEVYDETSGTSIALVQTGGADSLVMAETSGLTTLLAQVSGSDTVDGVETAGIVLATAITNGSDTSEMNETGSAVILLALVDGDESFGEGTIYTETSGRVLALVQTAGADRLSYTDAPGVVTAKAVMSGADQLLWLETFGAVLARAVVSGSDTEQMHELTDEVLVLGVTAGTDTSTVFEEAGEIIILATFDGTDLIAFRVPSSYGTLNIRLINPYDGELQKR